MARIVKRLRSASTSRSRWTLATLAFAVFALIYPGDLDTVDAAHRLQVTHWLWTDAPQDLPDSAGPAFHLPGRNGRIYPGYGIGQSLVMLPADVIAYIVGDRLIGEAASPLVREKAKQFLVGFLTFSIVNTAGIVLSFELLTLLSFSAAVALPATALFMVGSTFLVYMQTSQENSLMYLCVVGALVFGLRASRSDAKANLLAAGAFAGMSLLTRMTDLAYVPPLFLLMVGSELEGTSMSSPRPAPDRWARMRHAVGLIALYFGLPILGAIVLDRLYEFYRFGDIFGTYAGQHVKHFAAIGGYPDGYPFGNSPRVALLGPFMAPNKSIFLFDPILLFLAGTVLLGWRRIARLPKAVLVATLLALALLSSFYATTYWWTGDSAWGPRQHLVPVEIMCLIAYAFAVSGFAELRPALRLLVAMNIAVAVAFQVVAIPKTVNIEVGQIERGDPLRIVPLMRIRNLAHIAAGDFEARGLDYGDAAIARMAVAGTENRIFVFRLEPYFPNTVRYGLIAAWSVMAAITAAAIATIVLRGFRGLEPSAPVAVPNRRMTRP